MVIREAERNAYLFPGQKVGRRKECFTWDILKMYQVIRNTFEEVSDSLGMDVARLAIDGTPEQLRLTYNVQVLSFTEGLACWDWMIQEEGVEVTEQDFFLGHSAGQVVELVANGTLTRQQGIEVIDIRGNAIHYACGLQEGQMVALVTRERPLNVRAIRSLCKTHGATLANDNTEREAVISGSPAQVQAVKDESVRHAYADRGIPLSNAEGAYHCELMAPGRVIFEQGIESIPFVDAQTPIVRNTNAKPTRKGETAKKELGIGITSEVQWRRSMQFVAKQDVGATPEVSIDELLTKMVPQRTITGRRIVAFSIGLAAVGSAFLGGMKFKDWRDSRSERRHEEVDEGRESSE